VVWRGEAMPRGNVSKSVKRGKWADGTLGEGWEKGVGTTKTKGNREKWEQGTGWGSTNRD